MQSQNFHLILMLRWAISSPFENKAIGNFFLIKYPHIFTKILCIRLHVFCSLMRKYLPEINQQQEIAHSHLGFETVANIICITLLQVDLFFCARQETITCDQCGHFAYSNLLICLFKFVSTMWKQKKKSSDKMISLVGIEPRPSDSKSNTILSTLIWHLLQDWDFSFLIKSCSIDCP